ncbi:37804_t:CDS:2 [Gigaspora margarita]|uniref:37804_t:CDS:1 n=1 Tax=Gigaspora margarita TaxID=4874 RepID=A0ABM8W5U9_GIGMA|nr:37804_t:CDS:2 [Gigaspora margarita]
MGDFNHIIDAKLDHKFTWTNGSVETRIDLIWISDDLLANITSAKIQDIRIYAESNHKLVISQIRLEYLLGHKSNAKLGKKSFCTCYLFDQVEKED